MKVPAHMHGTQLAAKTYRTYAPKQLVVYYAHVFHSQNTQTPNKKLLANNNSANKSKKNFQTTSGNM